MKHVNQKAQLSLEFLVIMAGFIAVLAFMLPVSIEATKKTAAKIEEKRAEAFLSEFSSAARQASFLADGTRKEITVAAVEEWLFSTGNGTASIGLNGKTLQASIPSETALFSRALKGNQTVRIEKTAGQLLVSANAN